MDSELLGNQEDFKETRDRSPSAGVHPSMSEGDCVEWEIRIRKDGTIGLDLEFVQPFLEDRFRWEAERRKKKTPVPAKVEPQSVPACPSADTYVDQRSGLIEKRMYLRLAREKAFPSKKVGKRIVARWGDVQAALSPAPAGPSSKDAKNHDPELDEIRARVGLALRGR